MDGYVTHYNTVRLHSAIGYVTPNDKLEGREAAIFAQRDRKLAEARERRKARRAALRSGVADAEPSADAGATSPNSTAVGSQAA